jgi:MYXO-CTERM domain-containing protein
MAVLFPAWPMMRRTSIAGGVLLVGMLAAADADAQNKYLCCALSGQGACVAQSAPCSEALGVALSDLPADAVAVPQLVAEASFPAGVDGYVSWSQSTPRVGFCLVAPSAQDPLHAEPTEPVGCIQLSLSPGIGAAIANYIFPVDSRWDAFELCYGAQLTSSNVEQYTSQGQPAPCQNVNDLLDPTVSPTPASGSCCEPAQLLVPGDLVADNATKWSVGIAQEIPGVPPNQLVFTADGGLHAYPEWDAGDYLGAVPPVCLDAYNEPKNCGSPSSQSVSLGESAPADAGAPCVTCSGAADTSNSEGKGCNTGAGGTGGSTSIRALLMYGGIAAIRRRRRVQRRIPR